MFSTGIVRGVFTSRDIRYETEGRRGSGVALEYQIVVRYSAYPEEDEKVLENWNLCVKWGALGTN